MDFAELLQKVEAKEEEKIEDELNESIYEADDIPCIDGLSHGNPYKVLSKRSDSASKSSTTQSQEFGTQEIEAEEHVEGTMPLRAFSKYVFAGTNLCGLFIVILVAILSQFVTSIADYFVNYWSLQESRRINGEDVLLTQYQYLYIYSALTLGLIVVSNKVDFLKICSTI